MISLLVIPLIQAANIFIHKWTDTENVDTDVFSSDTIIVLYILRNILYFIQLYLFYLTYYSEQAKKAFKMRQTDIKNQNESWE